MQKDIINFTQEHKDEYFDMADYIFDNPETGNQEFKAYEVITTKLKEIGFEVEDKIAGLDTAFRAIYKSGNGGANIGLLCEYDALEGLGHACSHHLQAPSIILAAQTIINTKMNAPYTLTVYGTPAEETTHGKLRMIEKGYFKELDVALMMHGSPDTTCDIKSLALTNFEVIFKGKSAHAALKPEEGRSAFDAMLLAFNATEFLREHVREDVRMHYTILETPGPANVVPDRSRGKFSIRSYSREYLNQVEKRMEDIIKGASLMAGVEYEIIWGDRLNNKIPSYILNDLLMDSAKRMEAVRISPPRQKTGSSDFSNVMYEVPGSCIRVAFVPTGTTSHSQTFLDYGKTKDAHDAILVAARVLADTAQTLINDENKMKELKEEFNNNKNLLK